MNRWLRPVARALDAVPAPVRGVGAARPAAGAAVPFFFRDDDAGWGDERLVALLEVFDARAIWVDLAVIPRELDTGLARELLSRERVGLHQHGLAHVSHERAGRKCEFGPSRDARRQRADIAEGRARLEHLLGGRVDPIFTPPWNRCTRDTGRCLTELGFGVLSRESRAEPLGIPGLRELPVCTDWVTLDPVAAGERIAAAIRCGGPVGVMLHHAVMDDASMRRAGELIELVAAHEAARAEPMLCARSLPGA